MSPSTGPVGILCETEASLVDIIRKTEASLSWALEHNHDFSKLAEFHATLDIAQLGITECLALLRCSYRIRTRYPHWYRLRDEVLENLRRRPELLERQITHMLRGLWEPAPIRPEVPTLPTP